MELSVLIELINLVGFPITMAGVFAWYINKRDNQRLINTKFLFKNINFI